MNTTAAATTTYDAPVPARILDGAYARFGSALRAKGLERQEFRATGTQDGNVIVHPEDLSGPTADPCIIRRDLVEFPNGLPSDS